ncbi:hypothetical protein LTR15_001205 [Elasticomyces elasticus]|nr:hypothetical protein LTR15_001205 [Elasticomyces elasticus]
MSSALEPSQALDQLQKEVNRTLENIGHLFKAANNGNRTATAARASQLKAGLPKSITSFHDALDCLEDELQLAKTVMRRDLAVCRERSALGVPSKNAVLSTTELAPETTKSSEAEVTEIVQHIDAVEVPPAQIDVTKQEDTSMLDADAAAPETEKEEPIAIEPETLVVEDAKPVTSDDQAPPNDTIPLSDTTTSSKPIEETTLKVETSIEQPDNPTDLLTELEQANADDKLPDTATMSEGQDLESLFNDPASVGGSGGTTTGPATGTGTGEESAAEHTEFDPGFDFGAFNAGLDNSGMGHDDSLSALLPGLQDYANTQPAGPMAVEEPDFNALFAADAPVGSVGVPEGPQGDSTLDDFMNFAEFNNGEFATGSGEGGGHGGEEDFDFTFD